MMGHLLDDEISQILERKNIHLDQDFSKYIFLDRDLERYQSQERRAERPQDHHEPPRRGRLPPQAAAGKDRVSHTTIEFIQYFVYFATLYENLLSQIRSNI